MVRLYASTWVRAGILAVGLAVLSVNSGWAAKKSRVVAKPEFDPTAERVGLFEGVAKGSIKAKMVLPG